MSKALEALEKMAISHEIASDHINPYLEFKNPNKRIEINPYWEEEINIVKQALERNIPMKVKPASFEEGFLGECGNCGKFIYAEEGKIKYCTWCGQKQDWSEDDE